MEVRISVRGLVEFILRSGNIDNRRAASSDNAMQEGGRIHRMIQRRMGPEYQAEVSLRYVYDAGEYQIVVEGRADGIISKLCKDAAARSPVSLSEETKQLRIEEVMVQPLQDDSLAPAVVSQSQNIQQVEVTIDEIKGTFQDVKRMKGPVPVHLAQAKCYACIYAQQQQLNNIRVRMTYCHMETEEIRYFHYDYTYDELALWFGELMTQYRKWADYHFMWQKVRQESIRQMTFPFPYREGQKDL